MRKIFSVILYSIILSSVVTNAQDVGDDVVAEQPTNAAEDPRVQPVAEIPAEQTSTTTEASALTQQQQDSLRAAQAFEDILSTTYVPENDVPKDSTTQPASSSSVEESSSSEGGLVLYNAQSTPSERRRYSSDAPIYRFMATAGLRSPSRGIASFEYIVSQEVLNIGVHFTDYGDEYFQFGASAIYYPMEIRYFYTFLASDWIHGEYEKERRVNGKYEEYTETANFMRVVVGVGGEALFMEHFGAYIEAGFEFYAGNGGYYLHCGKKNGNLDNESIKLPYGIGLLFPF